ncbi:short-chain dehydrogenase [Alternaria rosae]|uniref:short-chain dehydrogenase n=1 Tax=Alternaria rosae TaxID=1187941 RepID=UPI001E8D7E39|nr:short-chain dehydrogenase [Alternaria rosae]KAH6875034.1 short-chain dehydrogenase [Alternaria rosae]
MAQYAELHKVANLRGAGDARPTALQVIRDEDLTGKLADKVFLITGVSSGLGIETLRSLHTTGAHVIGTVRNIPKGQAVVDKILAEEHDGGGKIELIEMELDSFASIRKAAKEILAKAGGKLNVIIGNAGVMATPYGKTKDGYETQFATNHLGHFLLFHLLKDALLSSATPEYPSRYVSVTSMAHIWSTVHLDDYNYETTPYEPWNAYAQAKTANIWFANSIERHFSSRHLHATSVHPGGIIEGSGLAVHVSDETKQAMFGDPEILRTFKDVGQGAATQVYAAVSKEWANKGGRYLASLEEQGSREEVAKKEDMYESANEGYAPWAYDEESEERLWRESFGMVGLPRE